MRRFSKAVVQSRAGLILGSAVMATLLLPVTAFAGGFGAPRGVHHRAPGGGGSTALVIFLGIIAVAFLSVLIVSRIATEREGGQRVADGIQRAPAGAGS